MMGKPTKVARINVLKRRRDYLAKIIAESQDPLSWDKAEKSALDWAIENLEPHVQASLSVHDVRENA